MSDHIRDIPKGLLESIKGVVLGKTEQLDELEKKTLKSYQKKATTSSERAWKKADQEEDKAMSTDGEKYPEKQKRHNDNAAKHLDTWNKREAGLKMVNKKLKEDSEDATLEIVHEEMGEGEILSVSETTLEVMFEHGIESFEVDQLDEVSKDTLKSYKVHASTDLRDISSKRGRKSAADKKTIEKRTSGLATVKAKLEAIHKKEWEAHEKKMGKLHDELHNHFHKEAPKILEKHGFSKASESDQRTTYIKPHESGHITSVSINKVNERHGGPEWVAGGSTAWSSSSERAHHGLYDEKHHEKAKKEMMPKFEHSIIKAHENTGNRW